ncbi:MAG: histidine kinase [Muribaculaceae bacterium]|nr:histidine kinase [Muribaculaceae bacterium]
MNPFMPENTLSEAPRPVCRRGRSKASAATLVLMAAVSLLLLGAGACSGPRAGSISTMEQANARALDSLIAGNHGWFARYIADEKREAASLNDSDRWANAVVQEGVAAYYRIDPALLLAKSDSAIAYFTSRKPSEMRLRLLHKAYLTKGAYFSQFDFEPDSAVHYHEMGVRTAMHTSDRQALVLALGNLADTYKLNSRLAEASDYYHRAILLADSLGLPPKEYISLYGGLASTYTGMRDFDLSAEWWGRTMELYPLMIPYERFNNLNNLGNDHYYKKDYRGALRTFLRLREYLDSLPGTSWEHNFVNINLADSYLHLQMPDSAIDLLPGALEYFTDTVPNPVALSYIHTLQMRYYALKGNYAAVEDLIDFHPFSDTLRVEQQLTRLEMMEDYYRHTGQYRHALAIRDKLDAMEDTLRSERVRQLAAARRIQYETDNEILRLRADRSSGQAHILRLSLIIFGAVVVIALLAVWTTVASIRRHRREEQMRSDMIGLRMQSVRTRITPHFIYNALNHELLARTEGKPSRIDSIVALLRHQQYIAEEIVIPLGEELKFIHDYVEVESDAVDGPVDYRVHTDPAGEITGRLIPSMSLQILVENAFKHGFRLMPHGTPRLLVVSAIHDTAREELVLTVFNNSRPDTAGPARGAGNGIRIIMRTLSFINSKTGGHLRFDSTSGVNPEWGEGTWASITIPDSTDLSPLQTHDH